MKEYRFDAMGYFVGSSDAFLDPVESENQGKEIYLLSANCTFTAPPNISATGKLAKYDRTAQSWDIVEDYTGKYTIALESGEMTQNTACYIPDGWRLATDEEIEAFLNPPEEPLTVKDYDIAMENHIMAARVARGYTTREPSEYLSSSVPRWKQDAVDYIAFRDQCMLYGLQVQNDYAAGKEVPTLEEFKANLPVCVWTYTEELE